MKRERNIQGLNGTILYADVAPHPQCHLTRDIANQDGYTALTVMSAGVLVP
jgi:hypothetical protein